MLKGKTRARAIGKWKTRRWEQRLMMKASSYPSDTNCDTLPFQRWTSVSLRRSTVCNWTRELRCWLRFQNAVGQLKNYIVPAVDPKNNRRRIVLPEKGWGRRQIVWQLIGLFIESKIDEKFFLFVSAQTSVEFLSTRENFSIKFLLQTDKLPPLSSPPTLRTAFEKYLSSPFIRDHLLIESFIFNELV